MVLRALRGRRKTAEKILENVGRQDPSMDGVSKAAGGDAGSPSDGDTGSDTAARDDAHGRPREGPDAENQASLGDFG